MSKVNGSFDPQGTKYTLLFMVILSLVCAIILATLAAVLKEPQELAKMTDRSVQLLRAAGIMNPDGYFQIDGKDGEKTPAQVNSNGELIPTDHPVIPTRDQIMAVYASRVEPFLVDSQGKETTFQEGGIDPEKYIENYQKSGYEKQPLKLVYRIIGPSSSGKKGETIGYVIPIHGMGLWDAIYGFLALKPDGNHVIGISWYEQKETPGLGANIADYSWQKQFSDKEIFQILPSDDLEKAPLGIVVVKGKVQDVYGDSPKSKSAVDGMAGATLTGNGVTQAYQDVLEAYRPFLIQLHSRWKTDLKGEKT